MFTSPRCDQKADLQKINHLYYRRCEVTMACVNKCVYEWGFFANKIKMGVISGSQAVCLLLSHPVSKIFP